MSDFLFSLNIVMPMAILLAIGYLFKRTGFFTAEFIRVGKKLCFYALLSCSLFKNLYDSDLEKTPYRFITFLVFAILIETALSFLAADLITQKREQKGVIIQGAFRSNFAYIGIPLATMFFTDPAMLERMSSEISLASIFIIPLFNIFAVIALSAYSDHKDDASLMKRSLTGILHNPCIISIVCGVSVLLFRLIVPEASYFIRDQIPFLYKVLGYLASMSTPFAFLLVGASLDIQKSVSDRKQLTAVVLLKDLIFPALALTAFALLKIGDGVEYAILVSAFASPTAVASAIMASEMDGDQDLANEIVAYTTLFSLISLLIIIYTLKTTGCL